ncbi:hypothetical protein D3C76_1328420 [compost metagenome]
MRHRQALGVNHRITKQHDVQVEGTRPPALFFAHATLLQLDALSVVQQRLGVKRRVERDSGIQVVGLVLGAQRRRAVKRGESDNAGLRDVAQRLDGSIDLLQRRSQVAADGDIRQRHAAPSRRGARLRGRR